MEEIKTDDLKSKDTLLSNCDYNLFNNPMIVSARNNMTEGEIQRYKEWGEAVFSNIDFDSGLVEQFPAPMIDALSYVEESLKSGQHPSTLTEDEKDLLLKIKGDNWYKEWGYTEQDLEKII